MGQVAIWNGAKWEADERLFHMTRTRDFLRRRGEELIRRAKGDDVKKVAEGVAKGLRSAQSVAHVVGLARSNPAQAASVGHGTPTRGRSAPRAAWSTSGPGGCARPTRWPTAPRAPR
jgi:hypothetical protein